MYHITFIIYSCKFFHFLILILSIFPYKLYPNSYINCIEKNIPNTHICLQINNNFLDIINTIILSYSYKNLLLYYFTYKSTLIKT